jgi:replicative DNA helicase
MFKLRQLPQNIEAEKAILSAAMLGAHTEVVERLFTNDFYRTAHQLIFKAISELVKMGQPAELTTVIQFLTDSGKLEDVGGASYITGLVDTTPTAVSVNFTADLIKQAATRRTVIQISNELAQAAYSNLDPQVMLDTAQRKLLQLSMSKTQPKSISCAELAEQCLDYWEGLKKLKGATGVPTGFSLVDKRTGGLQKTDLITLGARPGQGKTALAMNIAQNAASNGYAVQFFSLEMSAEQLFARATAKVAHVNSRKFRTGIINPEDWKKIVGALENLHSLPIYIDESPGLHYMEIVRRARRAVMEHGVNLIVIDYLQLVRGCNSLRKDLEIAEITGAFKGMAKELNLPVLLLSQLNRGVENRDNKRPRLSDLRDSGSIEQDSDAVCFLYRDEYYDENSKYKGIAELNFAKYRNGPTGMIKLAWVDWRCSFEDLEANYQN